MNTTEFSFFTREIQKALSLDTPKSVSELLAAHLPPEPAGPVRREHIPTYRAYKSAYDILCGMVRSGSVDISYPEERLEARGAHEVCTIRARAKFKWAVRSGTLH